MLILTALNLSDEGRVLFSQPNAIINVIIKYGRCVLVADYGIWVIVHCITLKRTVISAEG